jgi:uncharacterized repeat protein (TIGR03843 family)
MGINIDVLQALQNGNLIVRGEFLWGSNYTFLAEIEYQSLSLKGVYKPNRGERPLWDFPAATLARREVAAFLVSEALGWNLVPPTVYRDHGPLGPGSLQFFVEHDPEQHYFNFSDEERQRLRPVVLFDLLINNADRKGSHILLDHQNRLWCIDHGLCFHVEDKLRTVIWDFVGEAVPDRLCADLVQLKEHLQSPRVGTSALADKLAPFLSRSEIRALASRAGSFAERGFFPAPDPSRRPFPWPQI